MIASAILFLFGPPALFESASKKIREVHFWQHTTFSIEISSIPYSPPWWEEMDKYLCRNFGFGGRCKRYENIAKMEEENCRCPEISGPEPGDNFGPHPDYFVGSVTYKAEQNCCWY